ncbi:hypothetical protein O3P69_006088 [Scylla paramamosain]|uniref:Uncharacterized protein n=1 Tax=Scylla paramamosain TaxID=85552 RepID=A0AAW0U518_SCYPA
MATLGTPVKDKLGRGGERGEKRRRKRGSLRSVDCQLSIKASLVNTRGQSPSLAPALLPTPPVVSIHTFHRPSSLLPSPTQPRAASQPVLESRASVLARGSDEVHVYPRLTRPRTTHASSSTCRLSPTLCHPPRLPHRPFLLLPPRYYITVCFTVRLRQRGSLENPERSYTPPPTIGL